LALRVGMNGYNIGFMLSDPKMRVDVGNAAMKTGSIILSVSIIAVAVLLTGCFRPYPQPVITEWPDGHSNVHIEVVGHSAEGRDITCTILGDGPQTTFVLAAIHGDEPAGVVLVRLLAEYLGDRPDLLQGHRVVLLDVANPDGMLYDSRLNANGVDLNRNFPASNRIDSAMFGTEPCSEPETRAIKDIILNYHVGRVVSIHQLTDNGPQALSNRVPKGCIDYDGPAKALAEHMARYCDLPVERIGAAPGSLGSYAGLTLGIACITVELPLDAHLLDGASLWKRYGRALIAAIVHPAEPE